MDRMEIQAKVRKQLKGSQISRGLGTREDPCSVAAINLALTGKLEDKIPSCMSGVIGKWIIVVQDEMTDKDRNSKQWRALIPLAAGTGKNHELELLNQIMRWLWEDMLPLVQPVADEQGFGKEWAAMLLIKNGPLTANAANAANAAAEAANAAANAAYAAAKTANAAEAAYAAEAAKAAKAANAAEAAYADVWGKMAIKELRRLISITTKET